MRAGGGRLEREGERGGLALPPVLEGFLATLLLLTAACVTCEAAAQLIYHLPVPYISPFLYEYFPDLLFFQHRFLFLHHLEFFTVDPRTPYMYPAPVALPYAVLLHFAHPLRTYLLGVLTAFLGAAGLVGWALVRRGLRWSSAVLLMGGTVVLSYPLMFTLKQANMEAVVWGIVSLGLLCFLLGRGYGAATCFGIVGAMKLFPLIYLGLLLSRRQYRQVVWALVVAVGVTLGSLWVVYPHVVTTWHLIQQGLAEFRTLYMLTLRPIEKGFDHSLWGTAKRLMKPLPAPARLSHLLTLYMAVVSVAGTALYFVRIRHLPMVNQVLCLVVASILLPPTSFDYTLLHLYAPWALLALLAVRAYGQGRRQAGMAWVMGCLGVLLAPETELIHRAESVSGMVKSLVLVVLFALALVYRFEDAELDGVIAGAQDAPREALG